MRGVRAHPQTDAVDEGAVADGHRDAGDVGTLLEQLRCDGAGAFGDERITAILDERVAVDRSLRDASSLRIVEVVTNRDHGGAEPLDACDLQRVGTRRRVDDGLEARSPGRVRDPLPKVAGGGTDDTPHVG